MTVHDLKIWPEWFEAIFAGRKTFEIRKNDRNYRVGDKVVLNEFRNGVGEYTGRKLERQIEYIASGDDAEAFGLKEGYCVLGLGEL